MEYTSKVLTVWETKDITLFTHHLLPLQIPIKLYGLEHWWMSNFINIQYRYDHPTFYDYTDYKVFYDHLFDSSSLTFEDARHMNCPDYFIDFIEHDKYIYAWVDNYYIRASVHYEKNHDIHPILVYGYDAQRKVYFMNGFDIKRGLFKAEVPFEDIHVAFQKAGEANVRINDEDVFVIMKPRPYCKKDHWVYTYPYCRVLSELFDYMHGYGKQDSVYFTVDGERDGCDRNYDAYGINVTLAFKHALQEPDWRCFDYRVIHMISENKWLIYRRIRYFCWQINASQVLFDLLAEYRKVVEAYDNLRKMWIKYSMQENQMESFYPAPVRENHIKKMAETVEKLLAREQKLLAEMYPLLVRQYMKNVVLRKRDATLMDKGVGIDEKGFYFSFTANQEILIDGLALFEIHRYLSGELVLDGERSIMIEARDMGSNPWVAKMMPEQTPVREIRFYPDKWLSGKEIDTIHMYCFTTKV